MTKCMTDCFYCSGGELETRSSLTDQCAEGISAILINLSNT